MYVNQRSENNTVTMFVSGARNFATGVKNRLQKPTPYGAGSWSVCHWHNDQTGVRCRQKTVKQKLKTICSINDLFVVFCTLSYQTARHFLQAPKYVSVLCTDTYSILEVPRQCAV